MKTKTPDEFLKQFSTSKDGLNEKEAQRRLEHYGHNELKRAKKAGVFSIFLSQFKNALIILLIFACILSLFLGEKLESFAMFFIILLTAVMGFVQEYRAEKAIEALKKQTAPMALVYRDGVARKILAKDIVVGDIISLEAGDVVCADCKLIEAYYIQADESSLTGESVPNKKSIDFSSSKKESMAFMSTIVTAGKATAVVIATGMKTQIGQIADVIQATKETQTPLQIKFDQMAKQIGGIVIVLIVMISVLSYLQGNTFEAIVMFALTLTVAAVPNSLPVVVTVGLSIGAKQLAKKNMLIKKLTAAESLGATTFICSDKTGTLTRNQMTVTDIYMGGRTVEVEGRGYEPKGEFYLNGKTAFPDDLELLLRIGYLCNNAKLTRNDGKYGIIGDPTEGSLIVLGQKGGLEEKVIKNDFSFIEELPFDSDRKRMSVIYENTKNGKKEAYVKGAPDLLIDLCDTILCKDGKIRKITKKDKEEIINANEDFAKKALRVLGFAYRSVDGSDYATDIIEKDLCFVGLAGMIDPPRKGVRKSIEQCRTAGINVMIITGDHPATARAIAEEIGLFEEGNIMITGDDLEKMTDAELNVKIENIRIIARSQAIQKMRIVSMLQEKGHIVAMTGDGVNDAPALKKADIGVAMGITGTEVSKEVSKAILVDDNFSTIVNAVGEGRNIYDKMIKSVRYLLSCNAGEIMTMLIAILLKFPLPLIPLQILLMNLLTDDFPALGLGMEKADDDIMEREPRNPKEKPITNHMLGLIVLFGIIMGIGTIFLYSLYVDEDINKARTVAFTTLVAFEMFAVLSTRSLKPSLKKLNPFSNKYLFGAICLSLFIQVVIIYVPFMQLIFETVALSMIDWLRIIAVSSIGLVVMEGSKYVFGERD